MQWIDKQRLQTEVLTGTFVNLASATSTEIVAGVGFDWMVLDYEHGSDILSGLRPQLLACRGSKTASLVRLPSLDTDAAKFVMDSGAAGVMIPFVQNAEQARAAVACLKYPPEGTRGVASAIRATGYTRNWKSYFETANQHGTVVVQIETPAAVANADAIAQVDGVDVLFVGPLDLSVNLGHPAEFEHPKVVEALEHVVDACRRHKRCPGILTKPGLEADCVQQGFRFVASGSDVNAVLDGMQANLRRLQDVLPAGG